MSKASQIIILCEDRAHEVFIKYFLKKWGITPRSIRVPPYPNGKGSGKKHVEDNIASEAEALRRRQSSTILLVVQDADKLTYKKKYGKISESKEAHPFIDRLEENCRKKIQLVSPPDSLVVACHEFDRIRSAL